MSISAEQRIIFEKKITEFDSTQLNEKNVLNEAACLPVEEERKNGL